MFPHTMQLVDPYSREATTINSDAKVEIILALEAYGIQLNQQAAEMLRSNRYYEYFWVRQVRIADTLVCIAPWMLDEL